MEYGSRFNSLFSLATVFAMCFAFSATSQPMAPLATDRGEGGGPAECTDGVVVDDGSAETGYGWVPSVIEGEYVQEFDAGMFTSRRLRSVCLCWLRTRLDAEIDFEIVFYRQVVDPEDEELLVPADEPYAVFQASADVVPKGVTESFFEVDVGGVMIPAGQSYIGARWDPSHDEFFFICADTSEDTTPVEVFFRDDRSEGEWTSVFETSDPIFRDHKALMARALPGPAVVVDVPILGPAGIATLAAALALAALAALAARSRGRA